VFLPAAINSGMPVSRRNASYIVLLVLLACVVYYQTWVWLLGIWSTDKAYSHGFLIPFIAAFLVRIKRSQIEALAPEPSLLWGGITLLAAAGLAVIGRAGAMVQAEGISFLIFLPGIVLFLLGWHYLKALGMALFYLQFMVPWTEEFIDRVHQPFQYVSAELATWLLRGFGYPVFHDGLYIQLPNISLEVAEACSGVQFLTSVVALGIPLVYLTQKTWRRAAIVLGAGFLITILSNSLRVALAGVMGQTYGVELLHGPHHLLQGWFVSWVGLGGLFFVNMIVSKRPSPFEFGLFERWKASPLLSSNPAGRMPLTGALWGAFLFLAIFGIYLNGFSTPREVPISKNLAGFPEKIGPWQGHDSAWIKGGDFFPGADNAIERTYQDAQGRKIYLYVGYYQSQGQNKRLINFRVKPLYLHAEDLRLEIGMIESMAVTHSYPIINGTRHEMIFWYVLPSGEYTGRYRTKFQTIVDSLLYRRNNSAVVMISRPAADAAEQPARISEELQSFLLNVAPVLGVYIDG
jgi:EpsI family protein